MSSWQNVNHVGVPFGPRRQHQIGVYLQIRNVCKFWSNLFLGVSYNNFIQSARVVFKNKSMDVSRYYFCYLKGWETKNPTRHKQCVVRLTVLTLSSGTHEFRGRNHCSLKKSATRDRPMRFSKLTQPNHNCSLQPRQAFIFEVSAEKHFKLFKLKHEFRSTQIR